MLWFYTTNCEGDTIIKVTNNSKKAMHRINKQITKDEQLYEVAWLDAFSSPPSFFIFSAGFNDSH